MRETLDHDKSRAGKKSGGLQSPTTGMEVKKFKNRDLPQDTHDYDNVFGWNRKG